MNNRHDDISHSNKWTRVPSDLSSVEPILCVPDLHIPMPSNFSFAIIIIFIWKRAPQLSNRMTPVESGTVVGIFAEGKTHALAVGVQLGIVQHQQNMKFLIRLSCVNMLETALPICLNMRLQVGKTSMSTTEIAAKNKGVGVENYHYLNDGLWNMKHFKQ